MADCKKKGICFCAESIGRCSVNALLSKELNGIDKPTHAPAGGDADNSGIVKKNGKSANEYPDEYLTYVWQKLILLFTPTRGRL